MIAQEHGDMPPLLRLGRGEVEFCCFHTAGFPQGSNAMPMLGSDGLLDLFIIVAAGREDDDRTWVIGADILC